MLTDEMNYCLKCGTKLEEKQLDMEGMIPYCPHCKEFLFPIYSVAVSMIVMNEEKDKICLIEQYGRKSYILVAGYVNKGEDVEDAVAREVKEELGCDITSLQFNHSRYFEKSNTLMLNFTVTVHDKVHPNEEIDAYRWFTIEGARQNIRENSLAQAFLLGYLDKEYHF